jgi:alpha-beta hydrolase superfamily lysophospholipase
MRAVNEVRVAADDDIGLVGSLSLPSSSERVPCVIAVHGAAGGTRAAQLVTHLSCFLPTLGVGVLAFDRRGEGASGGHTSQRNLGRLTADVTAWVRWLKQLPEVDQRRIGLWAHSQGGWIAPAVAARDSSVAFIAAVSPCGPTPADQMDYAARERLRAAGHPEESIRSALALRASVNDCYRRPQVDRANALALIDALRSEPWFEQAFLPDPRDPADDVWGIDLDFDVTPTLGALDVPVLAVFGNRDRWIPVDRSVAIWRAELATALSIAVLPEAGHSLTTSFDPDDPEERGPLHSAYEPTLEGWLSGVLSN